MVCSTLPVDMHTKAWMKTSWLAAMASWCGLFSQGHDSSTHGCAVFCDAHMVMQFALLTQHVP